MAPLNGCDDQIAGWLAPQSSVLPGAFAKIKIESITYHVSCMYHICIILCIIISLTNMSSDSTDATTRSVSDWPLNHSQRRALNIQASWCNCKNRNLRLLLLHGLCPPLLFPFDTNLVFIDDWFLAGLKSGVTNMLHC